MSDGGQNDVPAWMKLLKEYYPDVDFASMSAGDIQEFVDREATKEYLGDDAGAVSGKTEGEIRDYLNDEAQKALLGERANEFSGMTDDEIKDYLDGEARKALLGDIGGEIDDLGDDRVKDILDKEAGTALTGDDSSPSGNDHDDPMNPNQPPDGEPPQTKLPEQHMNERLQERINQGPQSSGSQSSGGISGAHPPDRSPGGSASDQTGSSLSGTWSHAGGVIPSTDNAGGSSGGTTGSQPGGTGEDGEASGPPSGSEHYTFPISNAAGDPMGAEHGHRDADGNWYNADGSPMDSATAERMEKRYQDGELDYVGTAEGDSQNNDGGDSTETADDPPPADDTDDIEYTPSDDSPPRPGTPEFERLKAMTSDYVEIIEEARANSEINPVREGSDDARGGEIPDQSDLYGSGGDTRYDSVAAGGGGEGSPWPDYTRSQGAGGITYGPDANVDYGEGPEDEMPTSFGPDEDLSHLEASITGQQNDAHTTDSVLPAGLSPTDLSTGPDVVDRVEEAVILRPVPAEPVNYMAVDDPIPTGNDSSESSVNPLDVIADNTPTIHQPEIVREIPVTSDSGQEANRDVEVPVVDDDPGFAVETPGTMPDGSVAASLDVFDSPTADSIPSDKQSGQSDGLATEPEVAAPAEPEPPPGLPDDGTYTILLESEGSPEISQAEGDETPIDAQPVEPIQAQPVIEFKETPPADAPEVTRIENPVDQAVMEKAVDTRSDGEVPVEVPPEVMEPEPGPLPLDAVAQVYAVPAVAEIEHIDARVGVSDDTDDDDDAAG